MLWVMLHVPKVCTGSLGCALEAAAEGKSIAHVAEEQGEVKQDNGDKATSTRT